MFVILPDVPSEQKIVEWMKNVRLLIVSYFHTIRVVFHSPRTLVNSGIKSPSSRGKNEIAPIPFALFTMLFASLIESMVVASVGVDKPFFAHFQYRARLFAFQQAITELQQLLPKQLCVMTILSCLKIGIVLLGILFWARILSNCKRRYSVDAAAFLYLLPIVLVVHTANYCISNLLYRVIGESALLFASTTSILGIIFSLLVYGLIFNIVDRTYFHQWGKQRFIHMIGYMVFVPGVIFILNVIIYLIPQTVYFGRVVVPILNGDKKLETGDYDGARKLFEEAIDHDTVGFWAGSARLRLISVSSRRILALYPNLLADSVLQERLTRNMMQTKSYSRLINLLASKDSVSMTTNELLRWRDEIIDKSVAAGDVPITNSELDHAIRFNSSDKDGDHLPKEAMGPYPNTTPEYQRLYYLLYRSRVLQGEPSTKDPRRYLRFLARLPIRIELMFLRYRALNLMRDSETLAELDKQDRLGTFDRDRLVQGNKEVRDKGLKFAHLNLTDAEIEQLSNAELGFLFRQAYLNYLRNELRLLANSDVCRESSLIGQQAKLIEEQLNSAAKDPLYRDIPPENPLDRDLLRLLSLKGKGLNSKATGK